jgi:hypothetical protein
MIYIGAYLLIGMIYAGIKFRKILEISLTEELIKEISGKEKYTEEENRKMAVAMLTALIISAFNVFVWPFSMVVGRKAKKKKTKGDK